MTLDLESHTSHRSLGVLPMMAGSLVSPKGKKRSHMKPLALSYILNQAVPAR